MLKLWDRFSDCRGGSQNSCPQKEKNRTPAWVRWGSTSNHCNGSGFNGVPGSVGRSAIRIRIQEGKNGPQKWKINLIFLSAGCSLWRAEDFSCSLDVLNRGLGISKLQFWSKKDQKFQLFFSFVCGHQNPGSVPIQIRIHLKCWFRIRIRIQWIRIHNTASNLE